MNTDLPQDYIYLLRERRALLWLCQRNELLSGKSTHDDKASVDLVEEAYRSDVSDVDLKIASIYWEAIWSDSVKGIIIRAIEKKLKDSSASSDFRLPLILATDPDQEGQIDTRRHLPIYLLRGLLAHSDAEARFPNQSLLRRLTYQLNTLRKLQDYPERLLVILGAETASDLDMPFEAVADFASPDLKVVVVWPNSDDKIQTPSNIKVPVIYWNGSSEQFIDYLLSLEVPESDHIAKYQLRIKNKSLTLSENDFGKIEDQFNLILEGDLLRPDPRDVNRNTLEQFIRGEEKDWRGYSAGLVCPRNYQPIDSVLSLDKLIVNELDRLTNTKAENTNVTLTLPAQSGSGVTTLIRQAAFQVASQGYPTLILKQSQVSLNLEILASFLGRLQQKSINDLSNPNVPALIVFDSVHEYIRETYETAQVLSTRGRQAVVLRIENLSNFEEEAEDDDRGNLRVRGRHLRLQPFYSDLDEDDINDIHLHFKQVAKKYQLNLEIPDLDEWIDYQSNQTFTSPDGAVDADTLFWVALHFFLFNRVEQAPQEFGNWIWRLYEKLNPIKLQEVIQRIAVLSAYRLVTPITSLFRSFGNKQELNYQLLDAFLNSEELNSLLSWERSTAELSDQAVRFKHPLIAKKLIGLIHPSIESFPVELIWPILQGLRAGSDADIWLAENIAYQILRTQRRGRGEHIPFLGLRLETYKKIPPQISNFNKSILHHWARALYHGATELQTLEEAGIDQTSDPYLKNIDNDILLQEAIAKIEHAISLPNQPGRSEHPAHLYTTLGTIYFEVYKRRAANTNSLVITESDWEKTLDCFKKALKLIPDSYPTLAAYSNRLIDRAAMIKAEHRDEAINMALEALSHLSQAEDVASEPGELSDDEQYFLVSQKKKAWDIIDPAKAQEIVDNLILQKSENGFLIKTWREIEGVRFNDFLKDLQVAKVSSGIKILQEAVAQVKPPVSWRVYHLLYKLFSIHPKYRYDFAQRLKLLDALEKTDFKWYLRMRFEHATLCFQNNRYEEGQRRFRDLRSLIRQPDQPQKRFADYLRSPHGVDDPRITTLRVLRIDSEWRGYCFIQELNQEIPFRPRQFDNPPKVGEYRRCIIRFETMGPLAVPDSFPVHAG